MEDPKMQELGQKTRAMLREKVPYLLREVLLRAAEAGEVPSLERVTAIAQLSAVLDALFEKTSDVLLAEMSIRATDAHHEMVLRASLDFLGFQAIAAETRLDGDGKISENAENMRAMLHDATKVLDSVPNLLAETGVVLNEEQVATSAVLAVMLSALIKDASTGQLLRIARRTQSALTGAMEKAPAAVAALTELARKSGHEPRVG